MPYQIFHSPQVKRWAIITYKHGIYELPQDFINTNGKLLENRNGTVPLVRYFTWKLELVSDIL